MPGLLLCHFRRQNFGRVIIIRSDFLSTDRLLYRLLWYRIVTPDHLASLCFIIMPKGSNKKERCVYNCILGRFVFCLVRFISHSDWNISITFNIHSKQNHIWSNCDWKLSDLLYLDTDSCHRWVKSQFWATCACAVNVNGPGQWQGRPWRDGLWCLQCWQYSSWKAKRVITADGCLLKGRRGQSLSGDIQHILSQGATVYSCCFPPDWPPLEDRVSRLEQTTGITGVVSPVKKWHSAPRKPFHIISCVLMTSRITQNLKIHTIQWKQL